MDAAHGAKSSNSELRAQLEKSLTRTNKPEHFRLLIGGEAFAEAFQKDLLSARRQVLVQTLSFEGDRAGLQLARSLEQCPAPDRRVLVDAYTRHVINDRTLYLPHNWFHRPLWQEVKKTRQMFHQLQVAGVQIQFLNPFGLHPKQFFGRDHKKMLLVDEKIAYLGGINFCDHNFAWYDAMVRLEDPAVAELLTRDFLHTWEGKSHGGLFVFPGLRIILYQAKQSEQILAPILGQLNAARKHIVAISPYLTFPFLDRLIQKAAEGVAVELITPLQNNKAYLQQYLFAEANGTPLNIRLYRPGMLHMKALWIDGRVLIMGSSNFDLLSYRTQKEVVAIFEMPSLVEEFFQKVIVPLRARSVPLKNHRPSWKGRLVGHGLRQLDRLLSRFVP